jgi:hypothetical protein
MRCGYAVGYHAAWCSVGRDIAHSFGYRDQTEMMEYQRALALGYPSPVELRRATRGQPHQRTMTWLRQHLEWMESHSGCVASDIRCGATGCRVPR